MSFCVIFGAGDDKKAQAMALGDAVSQSIIANKTLAYFIGWPVT
jgi:hypothetical protein